MKDGWYSRSGDLRSNQVSRLFLFLLWCAARRCAPFMHLLAPGVRSSLELTGILRLREGNPK